MTHTHPDIKDPQLRRIFAAELITLRRVTKGYCEMNSEWVNGIRLGLETALRRVEQNDKNLSQYNELATMADVAEESLGTLRFGSHYALIMYLKKMHGLSIKDSRQAIKEARRLCNEFMTAYNAN